MAHFISMPAEPIQLVDPDTDLSYIRKGTKAQDGTVLEKDMPLPTISTADVFRTLFKDSRLKSLDAGSFYDLRKLLVEAAPGSVVRISDEEFDALMPVASKPTTLNDLFLVSPQGVAFLRAISKAPTEEPKSE